MNETNRGKREIYNTKRQFHFLMLILDVGCGTSPKGHVNIDNMQELNENSLKHINIKNFIIADGMYLPFKEKSFDLVRCILTLEHFVDPAKAVRDFIYVAYRAYIVVPNNRIARIPSTHLFSWSPETLQNFLNIFYYDVITTSETREVRSYEHVIYKIVNKIPIFGLVIKRIFHRLLPLRIYALCSKPRSRR